MRVGHPHFPFERAWLDDLVRDRPDLRIVDATQAAQALGMEEEDPHIWLSPAATLALARALQPELARLLGNSPSIAAQTEQLTADIEALDAELAKLEAKSATLVDDFNSTTKNLDAADEYSRQRLDSAANLLEEQAAKLTAALEL